MTSVEKTVTTVNVNEIDTATSYLSTDIIYVTTATLALRDLERRTAATIPA
jgi:hypothetical protein